MNHVSADFSLAQSLDKSSPKRPTDVFQLS